MNKLFITSACLLSMFLTGCGVDQSSCIDPFYNPCCDTPAPTSFELINTAESTNVIQNFAVEVEKRNKMYLQRAKTFYDNGIHTIQLEFISQNIMEIKEARELIVDMTENLLAKLNQNPLLGKDFANYPFRPANLEIYITFESFFGRYVDPYYVRWICMEDGEIDFFSFDILDTTKNKWHVRHEAYATSREVIVYNREAKRNYDEVFVPKEDVFGTSRHYSIYPKNTKPGI